MNIFKRNMTLIPDVFPRLMYNKFLFRIPLENEYGKQAKTRLKSLRQPLYNIYWSLSRKLSFKKSLLGTCKILRFFLKRLTADDKRSIPNKDNLMHPIQMHLSQKQKTFSQFFSAFFKSSLNFWTFSKKRWHW